jgi:hypothetical protein
VSVIIAGCLSRTQAWVAAPLFFVGGIALMVFLSHERRHPTRGYTRWQWLAAYATVAILALFTFLALWNAITGHCLGTDLNSSN